MFVLALSGAIFARYKIKYCKKFSGRLVQILFSCYLHSFGLLRNHLFDPSRESLFLHRIPNEKGPSALDGPPGYFRKTHRPRNRNFSGLLEFDKKIVLGHFLLLSAVFWSCHPCLWAGRVKTTYLPFLKKQHGRAQSFGWCWCLLILSIWQYRWHFSISLSFRFRGGPIMRARGPISGRLDFLLWRSLGAFRYEVSTWNLVC